MPILSVHNRTQYLFNMCSCAPNWRSIQGMYLKFTEDVDILVQIVYAKF